MNTRPFPRPFPADAGQRHRPRPGWPGLAGLASLLWTPLLLQPVAAQTAAAPALAAESRISAVTVYPGVARVERVLRVAAGQRRVDLPCLPAGLDLQTLRVEVVDATQAAAAVQLGAVSTRLRKREDVAACRADADDTRIRDLQAQIALLDAERGGHDVVLGYLRAQGAAASPGGAATAATATSPATVQAMSEVLRRTGQDTLAAQARLVPRRAELEQQLRQLVEERDRSRPPAGQVLGLSLPVRAARDAELRVSYLVNGPSWGPAYRATLDADAAQVRLERQALVRQATGEDWRGVALKLSTGRPLGAVEPRLPQPWQVGIWVPPVVPAEPVPRMAAAPAPAAAALSGQRLKAPVDDALFQPVQVADTAFATEFTVPGAVDVASSGEQLQFGLGEQQLPVKLLLRINPQAEAAAYVVAEATLPAGVWPAGPVSLQRGSQPVGRTGWPGDAQRQLVLPFGRDEQVRVQVDPGQRKAGSGGFIGSRSEQRIERAYEVENRRRTPVRLQVLEASPVSTDERVEVTRRFMPEPAQQAWQQRPGVVAWELDLAAGATTRLVAEYLLSYPKDQRLTETR